MQHLRAQGDKEGCLSTTVDDREQLTTRLVSPVCDPGRFTLSFVSHEGKYDTMGWDPGSGRNGERSLVLHPAGPLVSGPTGFLHHVHFSGL